MTEIEKVIQKTGPPEFKRLQIAQCIYKFFITEAGDMIIIAKLKQIKNAILRDRLPNY